MFSLYLLFTISYFLHLPARIPVLGQMRLEIVLGALLIAGTFLSGELGRAWAAKSPVFRRLAWLVLFIIISIPFVKWPGSVIRENLALFLKSVFFFIITAALIDSEKRLKAFFLVFLGCQFFRIFEPLFLHITTGYWGDKTHSTVGGALSSLDRLAGAPHDIINSNQYAWVIVSMVPFVYLLGLRSGKFLLTFLSIPLLVAMGYALLLTGSRSGIVCLIVVLFSIACFGEGKAKRIGFLGVLLVPMFIVMVGVLGDDMLTRYLSLVDHSLIGGDTAQGRLDGVMRNLETVAEGPQMALFGHGVGTSGEANFYYHGGQGQITHNLYVETLQETGLIGLTLLILYINCFGRSLLETHKYVISANSRFLTSLVQATFVWFIMNLVYSFSCFGLSSWEWYLFGGITHVCWVLGRTESDAAQTNSAIA